MARRGVVVIGLIAFAFVLLTISDRAATMRSAQSELLARTDVMAGFFDGTLEALSLGARMLENAPDISAMNDLAVAIPILRSVAIYEIDGALVRQVPPDIQGGDTVLNENLLRRHMDNQESTVVSADDASQRLQLSRIITNTGDEPRRIAVLTISLQATLARHPETLAPPLYGAALVDADGTELFHYVSTDPDSHDERCIIDEIDVADIQPRSALIGLERSGQIAAGKRLDGFPVRLVMTFDSRVVLERWRRTTLISAVIGSILILITVILYVRLRRQSERQAAMEQQVHSLSNDIEEVTDRLQNARDDLGDLAYVVAHDLKAPLRGISQLSGWLIDDYASQLDDSGRELLSMLIERVAKMNVMIEAILSYSRVNRDALEAQPVDLQELIETTIAEIGLPDSITVTCEAGLPTVDGDWVQLRRLFQNLIDNAARVVTPTSGSVRVELDQSDPSCWRIAIKDDGPGIDPKHHETIFRPLQTVQGTESETGTGMGLAICKKIAIRHNGSLMIDSLLGEGTVMTVQLPKESTNEG